MTQKGGRGSAMGEIKESMNISLLMMKACRKKENYLQKLTGEGFKGLLKDSQTGLRKQENVELLTYVSFKMQSNLYRIYAYSFKAVGL